MAPMSTNARRRTEWTINTSEPPSEGELRSNARMGIVAKLEYEREMLFADLQTRPDCDVPVVHHAIAALDEAITLLAVSAHKRGGMAILSLDLSA